MRRLLAVYVRPQPPRTLEVLALTPGDVDDRIVIEYVTPERTGRAAFVWLRGSSTPRFEVYSDSWGIFVDLADVLNDIAGLRAVSADDLADVLETHGFEEVCNHS